VQRNVTDSISAHMTYLVVQLLHKKYPYYSLLSGLQSLCLCREQWRWEGSFWKMFRYQLPRSIGGSHCVWSLRHFNLCNGAHPNNGCSIQVTQSSIFAKSPLKRPTYFFCQYVFNLQFETIQKTKANMFRLYLNTISELRMLKCYVKSISYSKCSDILTFVSPLLRLKLVRFSKGCFAHISFQSHVSCK